MEEKDPLDPIARSTVGVATEVRRHLGPGLLESAYENRFAFELKQLGLRVEQLRPLPVVCQEVKLDCGYRLERVVEDAMIGEVKAIRHLAPIHEAQLPSYLRISGIKLSLSMNFRARVLKNRFNRVINEFPDSAFSASWAVKQQV